MQLGSGVGAGASSRSARRPGALVLAALVTAISASNAAPARADDTGESTDAPAPSSTADKPKAPAPPKLPDASTKRASLDIAGYTDSDHVTVFTPSLAASIENVTQGAALRASYLVDVVSAASADIVSTASRRWTEARHAGTLAADYKPRDFGVSIGGGVSSEPDYFSYGLGVTMTHDFDEKNLTLMAGYGYGHDTIGRAGTPFSVFSRTVERGTFTGGFTRVINRSTVGSLSLDAVIENGDQSKPYRYIPMFSADVASTVPNGASIAWVTANRLPERPLEQLPLSRHRFALTGRIAHRFDASTLRVEQRVYDDNWALLASTTDVRWIFDVGARVSLWPHVRFHAQKAVDFWQKAYVSGSTTGWDLPEYRTGDRELGPLWTATGGAGVRIYLGGKANLRSPSLLLQGDVMYTSFLNDLYVTQRTGALGSLTLEVEL